MDCAFFMENMDVQTSIDTYRNEMILAFLRRSKTNNI